MSGPIFVHCLPTSPSTTNEPKEPNVFSILRDLFLNKGYQYICSDYAAALVRNGHIRPKDLLLMANETSYNTSSEYLARLGASRFLLFTHESPGVAKTFYKDSDVIKRQYPNHSLFPFWEENWDGLYPAVFSLSQTPHFKRLQERSFAVLVSSNKFHRTVSGMRLLKPKKLIRWVNAKFEIGATLYKRQTVSHLHETRLAVLEAFAEHVDLFGFDWDNLENIPMFWRRRLRGHLSSKGPVPLSGKLELISNYRFCFAIENVSAVSYITEKLTDAIMAGCVPVYLGCPQIKDLVPSNAFIDMRDFNSLADLKQHLLKMSDEGCEAMVKAAQEWLYHTKAGNAFSYERFVDKLISRL